MMKFGDRAGKAKGVELFGSAVLIKQVVKKLDGGLVLPENQGKNSTFTEFQAVAIGPEVKQISIGDTVLCGVPSPHQLVICDPDGSGREVPLFLIDAQQIKGMVTR